MDVYEPICKSVMRGRINPEEAAELCCPVYPPGPANTKKMQCSARVIYSMLNDDAPDIKATASALRAIWVPVQGSLQKV